MAPTPFKLVILDRDGTINEDRDDYVKSPDEWVPLPGALEAISRLNHAGWHTVLATNQSGLGRGLFDMASLNAIQLKMNQALTAQGGRIDAVFFCPHTPDEHCDCRKPQPGLMQQIGERFGVSLDNTPMVGDTLRDMQAGAAAGCPTHLVLTGKSAGLDAAALATLLDAVPGTCVHIDLAAFADWLIRQERSARGDTGESDSGFGELQ
ncbi:MAG: D-glycero-beta-D-manno-heptose 1,7-bisphosphate 7-phosphatase [Pseudomonadota bacterium]|nr:D-glycero-beta-D-manno-heptose 1,7-bisphosphate 7-phosphatase [Pseudomonadota bacterium]